MTEPIELTELVTRLRARPGPAFELVGTASVAVEAVGLDSRAVGPGAMFAAVPGSRVDGRDFIDDAGARGGVAVIASETRTDAVPTLVTAEPAALTGYVAAELNGRPSDRLDLVGVTGTNGKTSVVSLLAHIATHCGRTARSFGTLTGSLTTTAAPDFQAALAEAVADGVEVVAAEVSSHALDQARVAGSRFRVAVFTNLSQDHLDYHGDLDSYFAAKARLFRPELSAMGVIDMGAPGGTRMAAEATIPLVTVDSSALADVQLAPRRCGFSWRGRRVDLPLGGRFNIANAVLAGEAAIELGLSPSEIVDALASAPQVPGRFEYVDAGQPFSVVVDYSHTPAGLEAAIGAARDVAAGGRLIIVFGAAGDRDPSKRPLMGSAASTADRVYVTSDNPRTEDPERIIDAVEAGIDHRDHHRIADRRRAIAAAIEGAEPGDTVVIAGKGHEDYQIVGTTRLDFDDRVVARRVLADLGWAAAA